MSNTRFIFKYRDHVKLIQSILSMVNATQSDRVGRIYHNFFVVKVGSDQDFFEAINWYAVKVISYAAKMSLMSSRKLDVELVRFWNSVIIILTPLLGDHPFVEVNEMFRYSLTASTLESYFNKKN